MKEKEKGKHNPFVGVLQDDEEILWLYKSPTPWEAVEMLKSGLRVAILFFFGFLVALCVHLVVQAFVMHSYGFLYEPQMFLSQFGIVGVFTVLYGVLMLYALSRLKAIQPQAYAVTNKRLLTSVAEKVTSLHLDDVDMLQMSSSEEGHLFFSASLPEWKHLPHPEEPIHIIQQAKRIRKLEVGHEEAHDEKREEQIQSLRTDTASR
jgi:hypothetical protein